MQVAQNGQVDLISATMIEIFIKNLLQKPGPTIEKINKTVALIEIENKSTGSETGYSGKYFESFKIR